MSSGRRRMKSRAGPTTNPRVTGPKTAQAPRHPVCKMSEAAMIGIPTLAKPWPMPARARARPRMRINQREMETLTTIDPMSESPGLTSSQRKSKLRKILRLTEEQKARSGNQAAGGHQPSSAMAIQQSPDQRRCRCANENLSRTDQGKDSARDSQVARERFQEDA